MSKLDDDVFDALADAIFRAVDGYVNARIKAAELRTAEVVDTRIKSLPAPIPGPAGKDGAPGERGADGIAHHGQDGQAGRDGRDGKDGHDGKEGPPGEDGVGFDDLTAELDKDGRTVVLRFTRGAIVKEFALPFPVPLYSGVWASGKANGARAGECYTWSGSLWIALRDTKTAPGGASRDWQLAVKRGADAVPQRADA